MDEFFDAFSTISDQDDFDLAALKYFEELDRRISGKGPAPRPTPAKEEPKPDLDPEDELLLSNLDDGSLDSVTLRLMADTEPKEAPAKPKPASSGKLTRPVLKGKEPAVSELALKAAKLFDTLPTEDQLLAYTLIQKLAKAAKK